MATNKIDTQRIRSDLPVVPIRTWAELREYFPPRTRIKSFTHTNTIWLLFTYTPTTQSTKWGGGWLMGEDVKARIRRDSDKGYLWIYPDGCNLPENKGLRKGVARLKKWRILWKFGCGIVEESRGKVNSTKSFLFCPPLSKNPERRLLWAIFCST